MLRLPAELIPKMPAPVRAVARNAVWAWGTATAAARPLPDFLILGAQKAGTTALYAYLRWHPQIMGPSWKEVSFFDRHWRRGERWYRGQFPNRLRTGATRRRDGDVLVGEASPSYLFHPAAPQRVAKLLPDVKLIALLRNPTDRAFSHYQHEVALGREPLAFEDALDREEERTSGEVDRMLVDPSYFSHAWWDHTYRARGLYAEQLERWLAVFPRERVLVIPTDDLAVNPAETYARTLEFLGAAPHELDEYPRVFGRRYEGMAPGTRKALNAYYADPNRKLYELLGRNLDWS
jgi:hypothetical protein